MKMILFLILASFSSQSYSQEIPKLTLSASATIWRPADELLLKIGVVTQGVSAGEALRENSLQMEQVISNLELAGLEKFDYETSHFSINPTYTPCPKDLPWDWRAKINGYEVTNTILVHTQKIDMAGKIIDEANRAGANSITEIQFGLRNEKDYWLEALAEAGENAVRDAQTIANATNVRLVRVLSVGTQVHSPKQNFLCIEKAEGAFSSTPVVPGEVSITATVSLVYEIQ